MGRRIGGLVCLLAVALIATGCAIFDPVHNRSRMDLGAVSPKSPWLASWTAEPVEPDQGLVAMGSSACRSEAGQDAPTDRVITDQRGPDAVAILWVEGGVTMYCLAARTYGTVHPHILGGFTSDRVASGDLRIADGDCGPATLVTGFVPEGTDRLLIETRQGREVTASVAAGRFLAWWPGDDDVVGLRTDPSTPPVTERYC